ncbi:hypothetical protein [Paenibacillus daejeonensis]|uniref:hypothetical protein n=1 Tax=Paenibacillus daejeonensis TaxID=135193 RepID=UPI0012FAEFC1|nr:hypothetical protein [Paenibacillus daejeonensis]
MKFRVHWRVRAFYTNPSSPSLSRHRIERKWQLVDPQRDQALKQLPNGSWNSSQCGRAPNYLDQGKAAIDILWRGSKSSVLKKITTWGGSE